MAEPGCYWTSDGMRVQVADLTQAVVEHRCDIGRDGICECGARWWRFRATTTEETAKA